MLTLLISDEQWNGKSCIPDGFIQNSSELTALKGRCRRCALNFQKTINKTKSLAAAIYKDITYSEGMPERMV